MADAIIENSPKKLVVDPLSKKDVEALIKEALKDYSTGGDGEIKSIELETNPENTITKAQADEYVKKLSNGYLWKYSGYFYIPNVSYYPSASVPDEYYLQVCIREMGVEIGEDESITITPDAYVMLVIYKPIEGDNTNLSIEYYEQ